MMAKHNESRPDSRRPRSSDKGANFLSCSFATCSNRAIISDLIDMSLSRIYDRLLPAQNEGSQGLVAINCRRRIDNSTLFLHPRGVAKSAPPPSPPERASNEFATPSSPR